MFSSLFLMLQLLAPRPVSCSSYVRPDDTLVTVCERDLFDDPFVGLPGHTPYRLRQLDDGQGNVRTFLMDGSVRVDDLLTGRTDTLR